MESRPSHGGVLPHNPGQYLKNELFIELKKTQDLNRIESISAPADFIKKRSEAIDALFAPEGAVSKYFRTKMLDLQALNLPGELSRQMAMKGAEHVLSDELQILELQWPGCYESAFGTAKVDHNATIAKTNIADDDIIRSYKERKRAKKAARRALK